LVSYYVYGRLRVTASQNSNLNVAPVVVAAGDIEIGAKLKPGDLRVVTLPQASVPPGAFASPSKVVGRGAILPISKGDFVLPNKLAAVDAGSGLPSMIPPGMRAVSVRVNDVVSVAGFVQPGARVDVMDTSNGGTVTVLQNVAVIAVGTSLLERLAGEQSSPVITLLVSPDDAQKLALASQEGKIQLALRNPLDTKQEPIPATRTSALYGGEKAEAGEAKPKIRKVAVKVAPPPPAPYAVEMIRGNKRDETKFSEDK